MLGRPAIPRASLRFLRSALPPCARFFLLSRRRGAPRCRAGVCHGVPLPGRSVEMAGPPRFLGDLRAHALLSDPDGTDTPSHYGVSMLPSAILEHVGSRHSLFRGSITRPPANKLLGQAAWAKSLGKATSRSLMALAISLRPPSETRQRRERGCPWPKLDLKGVDHTTGSLQTAADKESQKSAGLRDERSVNGSPV